MSLLSYSAKAEETKHDAPKNLVREMNPESPQAILHELESFRQMGSVLYIAAHPDDENTELLALLSRGRNYRTAYLSLTRGDGGQNVLGADLGDKLGVARTQELLAARQIDGARQFFSRAVDFGFSKNYQETLGVWKRQEVLSDIVRVVREFKPDVLITRFSPSPGGTHGHHTTSAILAMEAFKLAGDPKAFPEQKLPPWQPKRILWNVSMFQKEKVGNAAVYKIDAGGKDPVSGESFYEIASASRAMHKTQGFDSFRLPGGAGEQRTESFQYLDGEPITKDILDGVDTTWNRVPGGAEIGKAARDIIDGFNERDLGASVPALLALRSKIHALPNQDSVIQEKEAQLDKIIRACLGLKVETTLAHCEVVPGEVMKLHMTAELHALPPESVHVRWLSVRFPQLQKEIKRDVELRYKERSNTSADETLPLATPLTHPYWLRAEGTPGMFRVEDAKLIGTPENAPSFVVEDVFDIGGQTFTVRDEPVQITTDLNDNQIRRKLDVIPPVSMRFDPDVVIMGPGESRTVEVEIKAARAHCEGQLQLNAPPDWTISPAKEPFNLATVGQRAHCKFNVKAPNKAESAKISVNAVMHGINYHNERLEVDYVHIPRQLIQPPALMKAVSLQLKIRGKNVGYLPGAGDTLAENLRQMGYAVKVLDDANLSAKDLLGLDAVVLGVRALNVRSEIGRAMPVLLSYVESGGNLIVQYNRPDKLKSEKFAPYDLHISADRVTDEKATMTFLVPANPVMHQPNEITEADFAGWIQERGLYFPNKWDERFTPILACNDPGESPMKGALLVAQYGKGYYVYTGLSFFRQLPAGIPGAYRLFANIVSIGK